MYNDSYIKIGQYNRIVHVAFNGAMIPSLQQHNEYVTKLRKMAEISLTNTCNHHKLVCGQYNNKILKENINTAKSMGYELAVVWFEGSWPTTEEFEENLLDVYDNVWSKTDWLVAGHIIDKRPATEMAEFDPQCVIINLKEYSDDMTEFLEVMPNYERSDEHVHDDYTPMYLKPTDTRRKKYSSGSIFNKMMYNSLDRGMMVHNLPYSVRQEKYCCYPEDDLELTMEWLLDTDLASRSDEYMYKVIDSLSEDKEGLFAYKMMDKVSLYITNTESVPNRKVDTERNLDVMTCPCSGLHQFVHMINAKNTLKRVIWTDFSEAGLWWTEYLINNWDGTNFTEFYQSNKQYIHDTFDIQDDTITYDESLVHEFFNIVGDEWKDDWDYIRGLDHHFVKIDLINEWERLVDMIGTDHNVMIQISNIWQYEINYVNSVHFQAQAAYINLINELLKNNKDLYVTGDTPSGVFYDYQNMKEVTEIR